MERAIRFSTPTLRISFATWAFTVLSSMPRVRAISRLDRADQEREHLGFAGCELGRGWGGGSGRFGRAIHENGQYPSRRPDGPLAHGHDRLFHLLRRGAGFEICLGTRGDRLQDN